MTVSSKDPSLIRLFVWHAFWGSLAAAVFTGLLLYFNVLNLWHLVTHSDIGVFAVFLLWWMLSTVFGAVQIAYAVMHIGSDET